MTGERNKNIGRFFPQVQGSIKIRINDVDSLTLASNGKNLAVHVDNEKIIHWMAKVLPRRMKKLSYLKKYSKKFDNYGVSIEIMDKKGTLLSIGHGFHSFLGDFEARYVRLMHYIR